MAAVNITISGVICDKYGRTIMPCTIVGEASITGLGVGGGPIVPPEQPPGGGGSPPGIWGPGDPRPQPPIANVPGLPPSGNPPDFGAHPEHPIALPPEQVPPDMKPPETPPPGTATAVPGNWPVAPVVPPEFLVVNYPGVGPLVVVPPPHAEPA